jgi:general secretion pathway protein B
MSLILEALKKSEAERRLGHVPGLLDQGPLQRRGRGNRPLRWVALLALVVGVAGAAFWLGQRETSTPASLPEATRGRTPTTAQTDTEPAESNTSEQSSAGTEVPAAAASVPAAAPPPPNRLPSDPGFASVERESRAQVALPLPPPAATPPAEVPTAPSHAPAPPAPAAVAAPPAAAADSLPSVSSLGPEARSQLPPLKVSMHVFTEAPDGRVVIIDGRRLREGDTVSDGVQLAEIRRDGSVLEIGGRRLLLARP